MGGEERPFRKRIISPGERLSCSKKHSSIPGGITLFSFSGRFLPILTLRRRDGDWRDTDRRPIQISGTLGKFGDTAGFSGFRGRPGRLPLDRAFRGSNFSRLTDRLRVTQLRCWRGGGVAAIATDAMVD